ncbi:MAG: NAD(P)/FAD-dependent oxidoreductase [Verrucomicrobiales bacterium]
MLDTPHIPASIIVLGGGAIALELAHSNSGVGAQVTVIQRSDHVLSSLDRDLGEVVEEAFRERGMEVFTGTHVTGAEAADGGRKRIRFEHGGAEKIIEAEEILFALGRQPNVEGLALDQAGVARDGRRVETDAAMRTSAPNIFAAGDTTSRVEVVHLAIEQGEAAAHNAALHLGKIEGAPKEISYRLKLLGIFTEPQVASVGLSEAECQAEGIPHRAAKYPFDDHGKSMVGGVRHGFVKLIAHAETGELLGGSVAGPEATELIHEIVVAMRFNATARQLAITPHYHPTLSEIWTYPAEELADEIG